MDKSERDSRTGAFRFFFVLLSLFHYLAPLSIPVALSHPPGASLLLLCLRQTPCAQPPQLVRCSTRPAPRTLTDSPYKWRKQPSEAHLRMSGGKACGKQAAQYTGKQLDEGSVVTSRDTAAAENEVHSSGHTLRKSMRLQDMSAAKEAGGKGETEKGEQSAAQKKRTRTTRQATQTQPLLLAADAPFAAALEAIPAEDWCRTWAAGRTIMLRRTSKRVKEVVDKMRLPAVVRLSRSFWGDARNGTAAEKLESVMRQLPLMTAW